MRQGYTNIQNQIFDLGLKPNEGWLCLWLLSHSSEFKISLHRATKELGIKFETLKSMIENINEKLLFKGEEVAGEILKRLSQFGVSKDSKKGVTHSKKGLQKSNKETPFMENEHSKKGVKNTPKMENIEITKNYQENSYREDFFKNPFIFPKSSGGELRVQEIERHTKGWFSRLGDSLLGVKGVVNDVR